MLLRIALFILSLMVVFPGHALDWPQWRGPNRDGTWNESGLLQRFPKEGFKPRWRKPVGMGYSSPVVVGSRLYLSDATLDSPKVHERVHCLDAATGRTFWTFSFETKAPVWFFTPEQGRGPGATPIVFKGKIYTLGCLGNLMCLDTKKGGLLWQKDLNTLYQLKGTSLDASPLIEGNSLILFIGGTAGAGMVALNLDTGAEVWRALDEPVTWSSPIVVSAGQKKQLIVWTQKSVSALDPADGKLFWREPFVVGGSPGASGVATPIFDPPHLLVSGLMFRLDLEVPQATVLWPQSPGGTKRVLSDTSSPIIRGDYIYSAKAGGDFVCLEKATGQTVWKTNSVTGPKSGASIHLTPCGNLHVLFTDEGNLILASLDPKGYREIGRTKILEPTSPIFGHKMAWAAPAFARRNIYARNDTELVCVPFAKR